MNNDNNETTGDNSPDSQSAGVMGHREAAHPHAPHGVGGDTPPRRRVTRLHAVVSGRVQGVGYRYWAHHTARQIGDEDNGALGAITGEVRNLPNGSVSVIAEADAREPLESLLRQLHRGPTSAHVEEVAPMWEDAVAARYDGAELLVV